jgi:hypothetical protein
MQGLQKHSWYHRLLVVIVALLISNVAALSCAMAFELCSDCPDHMAASCLESCSVAQAAINDSSPGANSYRTPSLILPASLPAPVSSWRISGTDATDCRVNIHDPSPPLNLLYCVFLK